MTHRFSSAAGAWALAVSGVLALVLRLGTWWASRASVLRTELRLDESVFAYWASGEVGRFDHGVSYVLSPVMPWLLTATGGAEGLRLLSIGLSVVCVVLAADLARRWGGAVAAWSTGLLLATAWPMLHYATTLLEAPLVSFLVILAIWIVARSGAGLMASMAAGLVLGIAIVARPALIVLLLALAGWAQRDALAGRSRRAALALLVAGLLPVLGIGVRNLVVAGEFLPMPASTGLFARAGLDPTFDGQSAAGPDWPDDWAGRWQAARSDFAPDDAPTSTEVGRHHFVRGASQLAADPVGGMRLFARKVRMLFGDVGREDALNLEYWRRLDPWLSIAVLPGMAWFFGLGVVGLWSTRGRRELSLLRSMTLAMVVACLLAFVNERMRLPLYGPLAIGAGLAIATFVETARRDRKVPWMAIVIPVALVGSSLADRMFAVETDLDADITSRLLHARMLRDADRGDESARLFAEVLDRRQSVDSAPEKSARAGLVLTLYRLNRLEEADQHLRTLESQWPEDPDVQALRGRWFLMQNKPRRAFPYFRRVLDEHPDHVESLIGIGWCQIETMARSTAGNNFRHALTVGGPRAEAWAGLGVVEAWGKRSHESARRIFQRAVSLDWHTPTAHQFLGEYYRSVDDDTMAAMYHYRQCLLQNPRNLPVRRFLTRARIDIDQLLADESIPRPDPR